MQKEQSRRHNTRFPLTTWNEVENERWARKRSFNGEVIARLEAHGVLLEALRLASETLAMLAAHAKPLPTYKGEQYRKAQDVIRAALAKAEG
jgi:hypothetical protein